MMRLFFFLLLAALCYGDDLATFPVFPSNVHLREGNPLKMSQVAQVLESLNGYTVNTEDAWKGLGPINPLQHPWTYLVVDLVSSSTVEVPGAPKFKLELDSDARTQYQQFYEATRARFPGREAAVVSFNADDEIMESMPELAVVAKSADDRLNDALSANGETTFNYTIPSDRQFIIDNYTLASVINGLSGSANNELRSVWITMNSVAALTSAYGADSPQVTAALESIRNVLQKAAATMDRDRTVVLVLSHKPLPTRQTRSLLEFDVEPEEILSRARRAADEKADEDPWNLAHWYDPEWSTVFAISAFIVVLITLSILGISVGLWFMDPGRDSIIYRMTSQRMKVD